MMKRFKNYAELRDFMKSYENMETWLEIVKTGKDAADWLMVDFRTLKPICYYLTEDEMITA